MLSKSLLMIHFECSSRTSSMDCLRIFLEDSSDNFPKISLQKLSSIFSEIHCSSKNFTTYSLKNLIRNSVINNSILFLGILTEDYLSIFCFRFYYRNSSTIFFSISSINHYINPIKANFFLGFSLEGSRVLWEISTMLPLGILIQIPARIISDFLMDFFQKNLQEFSKEFFKSSYMNLS